MCWAPQCELGTHSSLEGESKSSFTILVGGLKSESDKEEKEGDKEEKVEKKK